jgi:dTDP-4-dehydrorhamnose 3,5-epimerase
VEFLRQEIEDVILITPSVYEDPRGYFFESFKKSLFEKEIGRKITFLQENASVSKKNVLRGLHFQKAQFAQSKLIKVSEGKILDVAVDIRPNSKTFGQHISIVLDSVSNSQLFIPRGFAHGFVALSDIARVEYKIDCIYSPENESGIIFDDPDLNIDWTVPGKDLIISNKDKELPTFKLSNI